MLGRTDSRGRLLLLLVVMLVLSSGMGLRLAYWQVNEHDQLTTLAAQSSYTQRSMPAKRISAGPSPRSHSTNMFRTRTTPNPWRSSASANARCWR